MFFRKKSLLVLSFLLCFFSTHLPILSMESKDEESETQELEIFKFSEYLKNHKTPPLCFPVCRLIDACNIREESQIIKNVEFYELDISYNHIFFSTNTNENINEISINLPRFANLKDLICNFSGIPHFLKNEIEDLAKAFKKLQSLESFTLYLADNTIAINESKNLALLIDSLSFLPRLTNFTLNISFNRIGPESMIIIAKSIKKLVQLEKLNIDVCRNQITNVGLLYLLNAVKNLDNIKELNIKVNHNRLSKQSLPVIKKLFLLLCLKMKLLNNQPKEFSFEGYFKESHNDLITSLRLTEKNIPQLKSFPFLLRNLKAIFMQQKNLFREEILWEIIEKCYLNDENNNITNVIP
jgi:hypothetical protein